MKELLLVIAALLALVLAAAEMLHDRAQRQAKAALLRALRSGRGWDLELIERVKRQTERRVTLGQQSTKKALRDLEKEGWLVSYLADPTPPDGLLRRYYELQSQQIGKGGAR